MSGIAGIFYRDGRPVERETVARMVDTIAHRGPDGAGVWVDGPVGLGHRMLHTTPESLHERLPLTSRCGNYTITADARIDNRDELIPLLGLDDRPRELIGDTEIILAAYQHWGERCPEKLLGDFAFAIWDGRKRQLFCARDHFGVKPFYYSWSDNMFVFASEMKAILCLADLPRQLNEARVAEYFVSLLEGTDETNTFFSNILRLPAGCTLQAVLEGVTTRMYRTFDSVPELHYHSDLEYIEAFREIFTEAIRCRLRSSFPIGSMLSGGIDSSSIAYIAKDIVAETGGSLHTFSAIGDDLSKCPESPYLATLSEDLDWKRHIIRASEVLRYNTGYETALIHGVDPFITTQYIPLAVYGEARLQHVRIVLDGVDGDIVCSLDPYYPAYLFRAGKWRTFTTELGGAAWFDERSLWQATRDYCLWPMLPRWFRKRWSTFRQTFTIQESLLCPAFIKRTCLESRIEAAQLSDTTLAPTVRDGHIHSVTVGFVASAFERYDHAAALFGVEPRRPLFDRRLVEFCLALPAEQKVRRGWTKSLLRRTMAGMLPEKILQRRDRRNPSPWFTMSLLANFDRIVQETFLGDLKDVDFVLRTDLLVEIYQRFLKGGGAVDAHRLWETLSFISWWRRGWFASPISSSDTSYLRAVLSGA